MADVPVGPGGPAQWFYLAYELLGTGRGFTKEERAAVRNARAAGYVHTRQGWRDPDGNIVPESAVLAAGRPPPVITPTRPQPPPTIRTPPSSPPIMPRGGYSTPYESPINRTYDFSARRRDRRRSRRRRCARRRSSTRMSRTTEARSRGGRQS